MTSNPGLLDADHLTKTGYHLTNGKNWRVSSTGKLVDAEASFKDFTSVADVAKFLGVYDAFKYGNVTVDLIPEWSANTYTVKYNKNAPSGTTINGTTADSTHTYDTDKALTTNGYSINNYKFLSWNTKKDGTGTSYTDGTTVKNLTTTDNGTVTLYAQWKQDVITVTTPSLTGTTSFAFDDANHSVSVQNYNSAYMTQSGSTTAKNQGTYTVKWSLKDKTKYRWSDGTTDDKSATWSINWVNGTSHYSNDIYNRGWLSPEWKISSNGRVISTNEYLKIHKSYDDQERIMSTINGQGKAIPRFAVEYASEESGPYPCHFRGEWGTGGSGTYYRNTPHVSKATNTIATQYAEDKAHITSRYQSTEWRLFFTSQPGGDQYNLKIYRIYLM